MCQEKIFPTNIGNTSILKSLIWCEKFFKVLLNSLSKAYIAPFAIFPRFTLLFSKKFWTIPLLFILTIPHDLGLSVVNALSSKLIVEVNRDGHLWQQTFKQGKPTNKIKKIEESKKKGTYIEFTPDTEIFGDEIKFDAKIL